MSESQVEHRQLAAGGVGDERVQAEAVDVVEPQLRSWVTAVATHDDQRFGGPFGEGPEAGRRARSHAASRPAV